MLNRRVLAGLVSNAGLQTVSAIIQFVGIPLCLTYWGDIYYGEWLLLFSIPGYLSVADIGLGTSTTVELSILESTGQDLEAARLVRSAFWFIALWALVPIAILACSVWVLDWYNLLRMQEMTESEFMPAFILLILYMYFTIMSSVPLNFFRVVRAYHVERVMSTIHRGLEFLALLFIVMRGGGVLKVALAYLLLRVGYFLFVCFYHSRRSGMFNLWPISIDRRLLRKVIRPGLSSLSIYLGGTLLSQGISTAIGVLLGPVQLVVFSTARTLVNTLRQLVNMFNHSVYSEYTYAYSEGNLSWLKRLYRTNLKIMLMVGLLSGMALWLFGERLIIWWTRGIVEMDHAFFISMVLYSSAGVLTAFYSTIIMATNHYRGFGLLFLVVAVLVILVNWIGLTSGGLLVAGVSLLVMEAILFLVGMPIVRSLVFSRVPAGSM